MSVSDNEKIRVLFFGTPTFAGIILSEILKRSDVLVRGVVTQIDKPAGRGGSVTAPPVKDLAIEHGIPTFQPKKLKAELDRFTAFVSENGPFDIGVVVAFGQILPKEVLNAPHKGCVNIHASILPRWRGAAPIQRALMAGDRETGISLMKMDEGLDTGEVYSTERVTITEDTRFGELHDTLANLGAKCLVSNLKGIFKGEIISTPQTESGITYANKISNGEQAIVWTRSATEIHNQVRALSPSPGAFTVVRGKRVKILRTKIASDDAASKPGEISLVDKREMVVSCGAGFLGLLEVQPEGKRIMTIEDYMAGTKFSKGDVLGN